MFNLNVGRGTSSKIKTKINRIKAHVGSKRKYFVLNIDYDLLDNIKKIKAKG